MAIIGTMDLGIGDFSPSAYVRITSFSYQMSGDSVPVPEIEIGFANYHNKTCRIFEIIKNFVSTYMNNNYQTLTTAQIIYLQNNILSRSVYPLQTMLWATKSFSSVGLSQSMSLTDVYTWIKTNQVMGTISLISDDS